MANLRRPIASLLNGVSQQAPSLRHPSQCEAQVNGYSSLAEGLLKRPAMAYIKNLTATIHTSAYISVMNWSATEQFVMVVISGDLFVYDMDGVAQTVNFPSGKAYLTGVTATNTSSVTVEDITYIANGSVQVLKTAATAGGTYLGKKQNFAALPGGATPGDTYLIVGDGEVHAQGHYMQWNATGTAWEEVANPGSLTTLNAATMPHKLVYNSGTGQFTFDIETWDVREAGDVVTVPDPSFINRYITDVFFHRNRLGFLAGEYCTLSQSGPHYQNFFGQTATATLDNDRIDLRSANVKVSKLKHAVPFNRQLAVYSDSSQFILSTAIGQLLTPSTGSLDVSTNYAANSTAKPVTAGNSVYFPSEDTEYSSIREYKVSADSEIVNVAENITHHLPRYIPTDIYKMAISPDDDMVFMLSSATGHRNRIYLYKFFESEGENLQTSWSYWEIDSNSTILNIEVLDSKLYIVYTRTDGTHLSRFNLTDDPSVADLGFTCLLDSRVYAVAGTYSAATNKTTWVLPYDASAMSLQVIKGGGFSGGVGARVQGIDQPTATTVTAIGDISADRVHIGTAYEFRYTFSEQFVRQSSDNTDGSPILNGNLHLRNMAIRYNNTGYIRAEVTPRSGSGTYSYLFTGRTIGASLIIGTPNIGTGTFKFPVSAKSQNVNIDIVNDTHMPSALMGAEWSGNFTTKRGT